jgi:acetolactate synthase-1/2/3 large subunit
MAQGVKANKKLQLSTDTTWEIADLIVAYLAQLDVDYVFGIPGGAIEPFYNALARSARRGGPRPIVARHESGAGFMADGYYRQTRKMAVCCATTGPGATNLVTGVASAFANEIPMLVITAQTNLTDFGRRAMQESSCTGINTVGIFQYITKYNTFLSHPDQLERKLSTAIMQAHQSPFGPAHLSIPSDILRSPTPILKPSYDLQALISRPALLDQDAVGELCQLLKKSNRTVLVIGEGCSEAIGIIMDLAMRLNAEVVTTPQGKGLVSPYHPLYRGVCGFAGHPSANESLANHNVDLVLAVGTHFSEWASGGWNETLLNQRLVHIDEVESHLTGSPMGRLHVRGNILTVFERLIESLETSHPWQKKTPHHLTSHPRRYFSVAEEAKCYDDTSPIKPQRLMQALTDAFPPQTRYLPDSGNSVAWAVHYLHPYDRRLGCDRRSRRKDDEAKNTQRNKRTGRSRQRKPGSGLFRASIEYVSMGWAIGASIGTSLGSPDQPVVCITGDGSVLMSGQELTVAIQENLTIIFVILNDAALGMVKHGQRMAKAEQIGCELPNVDFAALAKALGAPGHVIRSIEDFEALDIDALCQRKGPTVLDVRVDPEEVPPIASRLRVLGTVK